MNIEIVIKFEWKKLTNLNYYLPAFPVAGTVIIFIFLITFMSPSSLQHKSFAIIRTNKLWYLITDPLCMQVIHLL